MVASDTRTEPRRAVFYWETRGIVLNDERVNPYGGLLARALAPHGVVLEPGWRLDPEWVQAQHGRVQVLHLNWLHRFYADPDREVRRDRFRRLLSGLVLARRLGFRLVWTMHNFYPHEQYDRLLDRRVRRLVCLLAHAVIAHCEHAATLLDQHFGRRHGVFVIPHGHFIDVYPNTIGRAAARRRLRLPDDAFVYVFFGNIRAYKGVEHLVETFSALPDRRLRLVIAGRLHSNYGGPLLATSGTALDRRIVFRPGQVSIEELQVYFNAADAAVFPFEDTLTSGSAIAALGFGCPIVVPAVGCLPELLAGRGCGVLYDAAAPGGLRRALEAARAMAPAAAREAALARARDLDWGEIGRQTLRAYGLAGDGAGSGRAG
jgi:glycosyltransferase involved in cell wall biosynthesis